MTADELIYDAITWQTDVVDQRLANAESNRSWVAKVIGFEDELTLKAMYEFFDRSVSNEEYVKRYDNPHTPSKKAYAAIQTDINLIYGYHKCFAMRHKTRMDYYRDDMSQKGAHTLSALRIGYAKHKAFRDRLEN